MTVESSTTPEPTKLRANAIGLPGVLFQSITTMAPASAVSFSLGAAIPFAGGALPLAVLIALIVCSLIALNIGSLARHLPSAGGYYTYVSRGLGVQAGWMTGWLFSLTYLLIVPLQLLVLGPVMDSFVQQYFHLSFGVGGWAVWAMIFAFLAFAGFESSAPLAEETLNPRRTVPRAILLAAVSIGVFYVFCSYAGVVGWGFNKIASYPNDPNPWGTLANRAWGIFSFVAILAILNSALANANAGVNAASRVLYAMGRTRTLPGPLAHISSRFRTPDTAIIFTMIVGVIFTLWPGFVYGAGTAFALLGTIITILILVVYMAACLAVPFFYLRERPQEFNALRHVLLPAIPFVVLIFPILAQFIPAPSPPLNLAAPICAAWFVLGLVIVILLSVRAPGALAQSNKVYLEDEPVLEEERSAG